MEAGRRWSWVKRYRPERIIGVPPEAGVNVSKGQKVGHVNPSLVADPSMRPPVVRLLFGLLQSESLL